MNRINKNKFNKVLKELKSIKRENIKYYYERETDTNSLYIEKIEKNGNETQFQILEYYTGYFFC